MPALLSQMEEPDLKSSLPLPSCHLRVIGTACATLLTGFKGLLFPFPFLSMWSSPILAFLGVSECHTEVVSMTPYLVSP